MATVARKLVGKRFRPRRCHQFMDSFRDKLFSITGGSTGIGLAPARKAVSDGAFVVITGLDWLEAQKMLELEHSMGPASVRSPTLSDQSRPRVMTKVVDVTDYAAMAAVMKDVQIDVLVCNAGVTRAGFLGEITEKDAHEIVSTNVLGVMDTVRAAVPGFKLRSQDHPSSVVPIGSLAPMFCLYGPGALVDTATKYAVKGYAECLRLELSPNQIRVNLVPDKPPASDEQENDDEPDEPDDEKAYAYYVYENFVYACCVISAMCGFVGYGIW